MDLESVILDRLLAKFVKYNGVLDGDAIKVPLTDDFDFCVVVCDKTIIISLGTEETNWHGDKKHNSIIDATIIKFEPSRPTFDPEKAIDNVVEMFKSLRLAINKFYKHAKIINKSCGNKPIHGSR